MNLFNFTRKSKEQVKELTEEQINELMKALEEPLARLREAEEEKKYLEEVQKEYERIKLDEMTNKLNEMTNNFTIEPKELAKKLYDLDNSKNC